MNMKLVLYCVYKHCYGCGWYCRLSEGGDTKNNDIEESKQKAVLSK